MNPILFAKDETDFTTNGLGRLECISCKIVEERNGMYELEAEIPVTGRHSAEIEMLSIIGAIPCDGGSLQAFVVYKITKPINGRFSVYARHISYRLSDIPSMPFSVEASTQACAMALAGLKNHATEPCLFTFSTDVTTLNPYNQKAPASIRQRLGGVEGSVLDQFGGEYEWDNFNIYLHKSRGRLATETGITLRYGKNITDINQEEEIASTVTGIVPYWIDTDGNNLVMLSGEPGDPAVYSQYADNYPYHITQVVDFSGEYQDKPTVSQLRSAAITYVSKPDFGKPKVNIKVSFVSLWKTEEYKDIAPLERVKLCDEINVRFETLGINEIAKVVKTDYDVLNERYNSIEVGNIRTSLAQAVTDRDKDIDTAFMNELTRVATAISSATAWLTAANGYVVAVKNQDGSWKELYFMNTNNPQTATEGIRFNNIGMGFFNKALHPGGDIISGPYDMAWTMDGRLGDFANKNFWNFITGEFSLSAGATVGGKTVDTISQEKASAAQAAAEATAAAALAAQVAIYDADIADLQNQIDGNVTTWYYAGTPTLNNLPASTWTTTTDKDNHIGDIYYDSLTGYAYRFMKDGNTYLWTKISDSDIEAALAEAQNAWDLADHKRRIFITQPTPPYDLGDTWMMGTTGDIKTCTTARATGSYNANDWSKLNKYTDDSALDAFKTGDYATFVTSTTNGLNSKITTFYQTSQPTANVVGDLWIDTDDGNKLYRWNGTTWINIQDNAIQTALTNAATAQTTADGKIMTYAQTSAPTGNLDIGDLWIDTDDNNKLYRWSGASWVAYADSSALNSWINNTYTTDKTNLQNQIDAKAETWYQSADPATTWTTEAMKSQHIGDLWYKTTDDTTWYYTKDGSTYKWIQQNVPKDVFNQIDGKAQIFISTPTTPYHAGDLWFNSSTADIMTCITTRKTGSYTASDWQKRNKYTDDSAFTSFRDGTYASFVTATNSGITNAQNTADSKITTYYQASAPTTHSTGDLWIDTDDGNKLYRWNGTAWSNVQDSGIQSALTAASNAQTTADGKIVTFAQASPPTASDVGDLWIDTDDNNKMYRWSGSSWVAYSDSSALASWISGTYTTDKTNLQNQIDGKAETWYQSTDPSTNWSAAEKSKHTGDLWYKTTDNTTWYYNGTNWVQQDVPTAVFDEIDGKAQIFTSQPTTPYNIGDLWFNSTSSEIKVCTTARSTGNYTASDWEKRDKYVDASDISDAIDDYDDTLDQEEVWKRLTDNSSDAIILENGVLGIKATAIITGILADKQGKFSLNMDTGALTMNSGTFKGDMVGATINIPNTSSPLFKVDSSGNVTASAGKIGDLNLANGMLSVNGTREILPTTQFKFKAGKATQYANVIEFVPAYLGLTGSYYTIKADYYIDDTITNLRFYLDYKSGNTWSNSSETTVDKTSGWHYGADLFFMDFRSDATYRIRARCNKGSSSYERTFKCKLYIADATVLSLSSAGGKGVFAGTHKGTGDFGSASIGGVTYNSNGINVQEDDDTLYDYSIPNYTLGFKGVQTSEDSSHYASLTQNSITTSDGSNNISIHSSITPRLTVAYDSSNYFEIKGGNVTPSIEAKDGGTRYYVNWQNGSDRRIKENITDLDNKLSVDFINKTEPKRFKYIANDGIHYGMIAQDARKLLDELGETDAVLEFSPIQEDDLCAIRYEEYIPHLINYVKDLRAEISMLKAEINELKKLI